MNIPSNVHDAGQISTMERGLTLSERARIIEIAHETEDDTVKAWALHTLERARHVDGGILVMEPIDARNKRSGAHAKNAFCIWLMGALLGTFIAFLGPGIYIFVMFVVLAIGLIMLLLKLLHSLSVDIGKGMIDIFNMVADRIRRK